MPLVYSVDADRGVILTVASGVITDEDVAGHKVALAEDPAVEPSMVELSDMRGIEGLDVSPEGITRFTQIDSMAEDQDGFRLAIVANEDLVYGMARMYQMTTGPNPQQVGVFREVAEAEEWLGIKAG